MLYHQYARMFIHPIPISAVILMALNDHYFKYLFANWFTGKFSDFLGLFYFPLFVVALVSVLFKKKLKLKYLIIAIVMTDVIFIGIKTNHYFNYGLTNLLFQFGIPAKFVLDPTDLLALATSIATFTWGRSRMFAPPDSTTTSLH